MADPADDPVQAIRDQCTRIMGGIVASSAAMVAELEARRRTPWGDDVRPAVKRYPPSWPETRKAELKSTGGVGRFTDMGAWT